MAVDDNAIKIMNPASFIASSKISKGLQYKHNYIVEFHLGRLNIGHDLYSEDDMMWNAVECSIPGVAIGMAGNILGGRPRYAPGERSDQDLRITFLEDSNMSARRFFDKWIARAYNPYTKVRNYPQDFSATDCVIKTFNQAGEVTYFDQFIEPFPFEINDLDFGRSTYDIVNTQVTFKYKQHLIKSMKEASRSIDE